MLSRLIRHATLWITYGGAKWLVDPMLSEEGENPPIANSDNDRRNPLVPLPVPVESLLAPDLVLVTHLHRDHWDEAAARLLPAETELVCQPSDAAHLQEAGFARSIPVSSCVEWRSIRISRTGGQHGTGEIGQRMGPVSGYVLQADREPTVYVASDTIYCHEVEAAISRYRPDVIIVNAGEARFLSGDPITMSAGDVIRTARYAPNAVVIAVHMEAINHCGLGRDELRLRLEKEGLADRVWVPDDGEWLPEMR